MKITMYELLGLVKDGKAPKKIKYKNNIYEYDGETQNYCSPINMVWDFLIGKDIVALLDDEVEIIEEPKKIENIKSNGDEFYSDYIDTWISKNKTDAYCEFLMNKINELIDVVNELKRDK